jgi:hypothetical protein
MSGQHYPITAEFLQLLDEDSGGASAYRMQQAVGVRSKIGVHIHIPASPITDSIVRHRMGYFGDLGIRTLVNAQALQTEYLVPPIPTMNAGGAPSFNYDYGQWNMTADGTPKVDFTLTGTWTSPVMCVGSWNGSAPNISVNGVAQVQGVGFLASTNDSSSDPCSNGPSGLLVQLLGLPNNGTGGRTTLTAGTHIVITSGALPPPTNGGSIHNGSTQRKGKTIGTDLEDDKFKY